MNKTINIFILLYLFINFNIFSENIKWFSEINKTINKENKPFFLYFYSRNCHYCRQIEKNIYPSAEFNEWKDKFIFVKIDAETEFDILEQFNVMGYPSIVVLDLNKVEIGRIDGYLPKKEFINKIAIIYQNKDILKKMLEKIKIDPENFLHYFRLGMYYAKADNFIESENYFKKALHFLKPSDKYYYENKKNILFNLAVLNQKKQNYPNAYSYWNALHAWTKKTDDDYYFIQFYKVHNYLNFKPLSSLNTNEKHQIQKELSEIIEQLPNINEKNEAKNLLSQIKN